MRIDKETKINIKWNILFSPVLSTVSLNWLFAIKHTSVLPRVETNYYKPLGASVLHLLQQCVPDLHKALLQPGCAFYNSVDDSFYLRECPQVDGCEHVLSSSRWMRSKCRLHIDSYPPALQTWEVGVLRSPPLSHKSCLVLAVGLCNILTRCLRA